MAMNIPWTLGKYFYIAVDCDDDGALYVPETRLIEADHTYADAKSAIANTTGRIAKLYRVNFALLTIEDVSENTAIALYHECEAVGEAISDSAYVDFIRDHIPASFDVGYRGSEDYADEDSRPGLTGDAAVYCPLEIAAE